MGKEKTETTQNQTIVEKLAQAKEVAIAIDKSETADDLTTVIKNNFGTLGHKVINRIILGSTPESALRIKE